MQVNPFDSRYTALLGKYGSTSPGTSFEETTIVATGQYRMLDYMDPWYDLAWFLLCSYNQLYIYHICNPDTFLEAG